MADLPEHPGPWLRDVVMPHLRKAGITNVRMAELLDMNRQHFQEILRGHEPITAPTAARLSAMLGPALAEAFVCQMARRELALHAARLDNVLGALPDLRGTPLVPEPTVRFATAA